MKKKLLNKRKALLILFTTILVVFHWPLPTYADLGPKPSITIQLVGFEKGVTFYK